MLIVDADAHVDEARDLWTSRMSHAKWGDLIPRMKWNREANREQWYVGDQRIADGTHSSMMPGTTNPDVPERWPHMYADMPRSIDEVHPAAYDAEARLRVMDQYGIWATTLYPNLNFVSGSIHATVEDPAFQIECLRAYNDWLYEWCQTDPGRLIPLACIPYWNVDEAVKEIERVAALGFTGLVSTGTPHKPPHDCAFLGDRSWDPLWRAAEECGMSISFHVGGGDASAHANPARLAVEGARVSSARACTAMFLENAISMNDLLLSGVLPRFPGLKFVAVETGVGWVPFVLDAADFNFRKAKVWLDHPEFETVPSDYFRRQVYTTYWFERLDPFYVERVGAENIMFESDFPHSVCLDGAQMRALVDSGFDDVSDEVRDLVMGGNAARLYGLEPDPQRLAAFERRAAAN